MAACVLMPVPLFIRENKQVHIWLFALVIKCFSVISLDDCLNDRRAVDDLGEGEWHFMTDIRCSCRHEECRKSGFSSRVDCES
jgi:hypothetical protein